MSSATIVWLRNDLRIQDNPALYKAVKLGHPIIPVYIWSPEEDGEHEAGGATKWWLHQSLESLKRDLDKIGLGLVIKRNKAALGALQELIEETKARRVFWNRRYEPHNIEIDKRIKSSLKSDDIEVESFYGNLLFEPWEVSTNSGTPYKVFTPFWRACNSLPEPKGPCEIESKAKPFKGKIQSIPLKELRLEPKIKWAEEIRSFWTPGEAGARKRMDAFFESAVYSYNDERNRPDHDGVSYLSPHLHFGEISPRQILYRAKQSLEEQSSKDDKKAVQVYLSEIGWREFAHHIMYHFPDTLTEPLRDNFNNFPWRDDNLQYLKAWQKGLTGFPIVDAGMRQLWAIGWMHNRVRMIVASFLTKDLLISWKLGAEWFWDTLVDADLASNTFGWQWTAGCGADAAPFFRIFNPILQGKKFDPEGDYVRQWVPELKNLPNKWIHEPWTASPEVLESAGINLGETYPNPIVDHGLARNKALEIYQSIKS